MRCFDSLLRVRSIRRPRTRLWEEATERVREALGLPLDEEGDLLAAGPSARDAGDVESLLMRAESATSLENVSIDLLISGLGDLRNTNAC